MNQSYMINAFRVHIQPARYLGSSPCSRPIGRQVSFRKSIHDTFAALKVSKKSHESHDSDTRKLSQGSV